MAKTGKKRMMGRIKDRRSRRQMARVAVVLTALIAAIASLVSGTDRLWASLPPAGADVPSATERIAALDRPEPATEPASGASVARLTKIFHRLGYDLATVRNDGKVPRVFLDSLPPDLGDMTKVEKRKLVFLKAVLPLVLHVNDVICEDRNRVLALKARVEHGGKLTAKETAWLARVAEDYGLDPNAGFAKILAHVDVIPPSLALAQAAVESGWGTSRFAQQANALFGQHTMSGDGMVPLDRDPGKSHKVRAFDYLVDAVKAYAINLNSNPAYAGFRKLRARMRAENREPDGYALAETLIHYSARRDAYVKELRLTIRANDLRALDEAHLSHSVTLRVADADSPI